MLQNWGTLNAQNRPPPSKSPQSLHRETPEHREVRLRRQYEHALFLHHQNNAKSAKIALSAIATDLSKSQLARRRDTKSLKRPRDESPLWERKLRYAVHRNLADIHRDLNDNLSAMHSYLRALDDDRSDFLVWLRAARAAAICGRLHVARRAYEVALTMRPAHWLCVAPYHSVLHAIGDADEDVNPPKNPAHLNPDVIKMLNARSRFLSQEIAVANSPESKAPEPIVLKEFSWACLVDVLRVCLQQRMSATSKGRDYNVGHSILLIFPRDDTTPRVEDVEMSHVVMISEDASNDAAERGNPLDLVELSDGKANINSKPVDVVHIISDSSPSSKAVGDSPGNTPSKITPNSKIHPQFLSAAEHVVESINASVKHADHQPEKSSSISHQKAELVNRVTGQQSHTESQHAPRDENNKVSDASFVRRESEAQKKPELRRSTRPRPQMDPSEEGDRRRTRTGSGIEHSTNVDSELIRTLLDICLDRTEEGASSPAINHTNDLDAHNTSTSNPQKMDNNLESQRNCSWSSILDERAEAFLVRKCIESFNKANSGPADLLLRVLASLTEIKVAQYSSTLALLWSTIRENLQLHMPGPPATSALVVEAMLVSGKKASKAKAQRFQEAGRLLSNIKCPTLDDSESKFLNIRIAWAWSILQEYKGEMQMSFDAAEHTLALLRDTKCTKKTVILESAGPELSGYTFSALEEVINNRLSRLRRARDLEKAEEELSKVAQGDIAAAIRTVSILASSVHASVKSLELDLWDENDLKIEFSDPSELQRWEARLDAEVDLEPRLIVFGEACSKSSDFIGELVCFSIRLRMAVHYYAAKLRSELEKEPGQGKDGDSSEGRLADLLIQIRKYVSLIKKIAASSNAELWTSAVGVSGWSMENAASIATITLVSLTKLIITKIPALQFSSGNVELGASQKNRRLGFTRCMLGFVRCLVIIRKCQKSLEEDDNEILATEKDAHLTRKMLHATSFCLRALVARGCCREEGTSGALMKLYVIFLSARLKEITLQHQNKNHNETNNLPTSEMVEKTSLSPSEGVRERIKSNSSSSCSSSKYSGSGMSNNSDDDDICVTKAELSYNWNNVNVIRRELAQCYQCLYQIQDLEPAPTGPKSTPNVRWLEEGCRVSKHIGLSFTTGDPIPPVPTIDAEVCNNIYFFYRKRISEAVSHKRRDGGRGKRIREVLSRLAEALPEDPPSGVRILPFQQLDNIVSDVVNANEDISREAAENVSRLEEEWDRGEQPRESTGSSPSDVRKVQFSIMYFELFSLHALSILATYEAEYKKHKSAERRKTPKEVADKLLTASSECLIALRSRPWSVGAWILLGRIFVDIADLALDERELYLSSFGLYRPEDLATLGEGDCIGTLFGRAEACFGFADSLLHHSWARKASNEIIGIGVAHVLGYAFDASEDEQWCGFGDDGDLFSAFGLTNATTSRPCLLNEKHPGSSGNKTDTRRLAAIRFGSSALSVLRLREFRYFHIHWNHCTLRQKFLTHPRNRFPDSAIDLSVLALKQLREGRDLYSKHDEKPLQEGGMGASEQAPWTLDHVGINRLQWYYSFVEAKLMRKLGRPSSEYLAVFQRAVQENRRLKAHLKQPPDIEPVYKLHASRMKILRATEDDESATSTLTLLEKCSFNLQTPIPIDDIKGKDVEDWVVERKTAIAEDILSAMHYCCNPKSDVAYSEFYFKSTFCKALLLSEVLKDVRAAIEELNKLFRTDAAIKALDQGPEGIYRGYFYKIWNYRITDTGIEPALESERKLVRWRGKLLGLYGHLLKQTGDWRMLAAIICRLKKRNAEDLPVDGALLDDLIEAYAVTSRAAILMWMEKGIVRDAIAFEASFRRTWDIYVESLRLAQGIKRVRVGINRGEKNETGSERLVLSGRPYCVVPIHTALRLEHIRWKSAVEGVPIDLGVMRTLPISGPMNAAAQPIRLAFVETLQVSVSKWALEEKMMKLLLRRIAEYTAV